MSNRSNAPTPGRPAGPPAAAPHRYEACKATAERALAALLLVAASPVLAAAAVLVRLTSRGPAIYRQVRTGRGGAAYTILKLRTMHHDCERATGPRWSAPGDPRITRVGAFLRRTHIDEFPQLWNVLRGEMSLIGPRPERPEFVRQLERAIPDYGRRLSVRPGITGLAQMQLPPDTDLAGVRRKLAYDLYYIANHGPWLDLRILAATGLSLVGIPFSLSRRALRVPGRAEVEPGATVVGGEGVPALAEPRAAELEVMPQVQSAY